MQPRPDAPTLTAPSASGDARSPLARLRNALGTRGHELGVALHHQLERVETLVETGAAALTTRSDEARLQAHLAVLEAKDRFAALEPVLRRVGSQDVGGMLAAFPDDATKLQLTLARMEMGDAIDERRERARAELARATTATKDALTALELRVGEVAKELSKFV